MPKNSNRESKLASGLDGEKVRLSKEEVESLLSRMGKEESRFNIDLRVGDLVKVIDGPFNNFTGFIKDVNEEKMKLKVMVSIFGRKTPVELDFSQVELEK